MPGATGGDAAQFLDVDVHELAGMASLVAVGRLGRLEARALAEPETLEPQRHRREREHEDLRDLGGRHAQAPECLDRPNPVGWEAAGTSPRLRGAIEQLAIAVAVALEPLACRALATTCGLGCLC